MSSTMREKSTKSAAPQREREASYKKAFALITNQPKNEGFSFKNTSRTMREQQTISKRWLRSNAMQ